jgi:hypothetical protein
MKKNMTPLEWAKKAFEYIKENHRELIGLALNAAALGLQKGV